MLRTQPYILIAIVLILHFLFASLGISAADPSATSLISSTAVLPGSTAVISSSSIATTGSTAVVSSSSIATTGSTTVVSSSVAPKTSPTSSTKGTEFWDKAIDLATPFGTFIIVVAAIALMLIFLIACICFCCKYTKLKKKNNFPERGIAINDSDWIRSNDDLLMWERNLRASEVKTTNGFSNRPYNDKRA